MAELVELDGHGPVCLDCVYGACSRRSPCEVDGCRCECRDLDGGRARALDDRPAEALASLARDMAAERHDPDALVAELPTLAELRAERFGPLRRAS